MGSGQRNEGRGGLSAYDEWASQFEPLVAKQDASYEQRASWYEREARSQAVKANAMASLVYRLERKITQIRRWILAAFLLGLAIGLGTIWVA